jgi:TonB family protein
MTPFDLVLRVSLVLTIAWTLASLLHRQQAALRHWVLAIGLTGAAFVPLVAPLAPAWHLPRGKNVVAITPSPVMTIQPPRAFIATDPEIAISGRPIAPPAREPQGPALVSMLAWLWFGGAVLALAILAAGLARLAWIGRRATPFADPVWTTMRDEIARVYGVSRRAALLETDRPLIVTWGVLRPKILVPRGAAAWPASRIRTVLAHELAHIARGDWLTQMAAEIVRAAHWCNPLAWIVCRRARLESEHACDDMVLNLGIQGPEYASHLLDLARTMHTRRHAWVPAQAIVRPSSLERRVAAMLNARLNHDPLSRAGRVAASVAVALVTILAAGFSAAQGTTILSGTLTDQLGGVLPNVPVAVADVTTNAKHEVRTDRSGRYEFVALPSGSYKLTIAQPGFRHVDQAIALSGATMTQDFVLRIAAIQETIFVADAPSAPMPEAKKAIIAKKRQAAPPCTADCVGGNIGVPWKLKDVKPIYPESAKGIGGVVALRGIIDTTGHVGNLQVVGDANPDLAQAAITAVSQWEFDATQLDGQPVETEMNVNITFKPTK